MAIETLIFDYGGVISTGGKGLEPAIRLAKNLSIPQTEATRLILSYWDDIASGQLSEGEFWSNASETFGHHIPISARDIWNTYENCMSPQKEVIQFLKQLKDIGYQIGLLSNVIPATAKSIRDNGGYDIFDFTVLSCEVGLLKPNQRIYELCSIKLRSKNMTHAAFFDDQLLNLGPAAALGMKTVHVKNARQLVESIQELLGTAK